MGSITNVSQNDSCSVIDATATDSASVLLHATSGNRLAGAYLALLLFMVIYCARPEDWIPGLMLAPLAKIAGGLALLALLFSLTEIRSSLPREVVYLVLLIGQLFLASVMSPVWPGGAVLTTLDFAKVLLVVIVMFAAVNSTRRLRQLISIQAASVGVIAAVAIWKGRSLGGRLEGKLGGNYSNPNDLALAIVISLPLCLGLLFLTRNKVWKFAWALAMLAMVYVVFLTGSRGGFLSLVVMVATALWEFAIRGRRRYLIGLVALAGAIFWLSSNGMLASRLAGTFNSEEDVASAYGSSQQRQELFWQSVDVTEEHPLFGIGPGNFPILSGSWHVTHNAYTQVSSEGGLPALVLFGLVLWLGCKNVMKSKRLGQGRKEITILAGSLNASLAGFIVGSIFASTAYQFFPYFLVAYSTALLAISKNSASFSRQIQLGNESMADNAEPGNTAKSALPGFSF